MKQALKLLGWLIIPTILLSQCFVPWLSPEWRRLQGLGRFDGDFSNVYWWRVASRTTWWGKPLDPSHFWKDRPIWNDDLATVEAHRYGRGYPPMPTHRPDLIANFPLAARSQDDFAPGPFSGGLDSGPVIPFRGNDAEGAYWGWFWTNKPKPPAVLEREQFDVAETIFRRQKPLIINGRDIHATHSQTEPDPNGRASQIGIPEEALTEQALFWAYIVRKRKDYSNEQAIASKWNPPRYDRLNRFLDRLAVDPKFLTEPLSAEQLAAANAWKIDYLRRLRRENADELYIEAYLKAWGLSATNVFAEKRD